MWTPPDGLAPGAVIRRLIRAADRATLGVLGATMAGHPYVSLVEIASDPAGRPILLLSDLAEHAKALALNPAASLLIDGTAGFDAPLTGPRASLVGTLEKVDARSVSARYLARHPDAALYAGFRDFAFYRFDLDKAHLVAGFGRIHWADKADILLSDPPAVLAEAEADILAHMNADHSDAIGLYANVLLGLPGVGWRMIGIDAEGCDLANGPSSARLDFDKPVQDGETARAALVRLVKQARQQA